MVDPAVIYTWDLATSSQAFSARLRSAVLGNGVSSGHVYSPHSAIIRALDLDFLVFIPRFFIFVALAAWLITFIGLIHTLLRPSSLNTARAASTDKA